jgi:hypothetical protein
MPIHPDPLGENTRIIKTCKKCKKKGRENSTKKYQEKSSKETRDDA